MRDWRERHADAIPGRADGVSKGRSGAGRHRDQRVGRGDGESRFGQARQTACGSASIATPAIACRDRSRGLRSRRRARRDAPRDRRCATLHRDRAQMLSSRAADRGVAMFASSDVDRLARRRGHAMDGWSVRCPATERWVQRRSAVTELRRWRPCPPISPMRQHAADRRPARRRRLQVCQAMTAMSRDAGRSADGLTQRRDAQLQALAALSSRRSQRDSGRLGCVARTRSDIWRRMAPACVTVRGNRNVRALRSVQEFGRGRYAMPTVSQECN